MEAWTGAEVRRRVVHGRADDDGQGYDFTLLHEREDYVDGMWIAVIVYACVFKSRNMDVNGKAQRNVRLAHSTDGKRSGSSIIDTSWVASPSL